MLYAPLRLENKLYLLTHTTQISTYDFDFELYFSCQHPLYLEHLVPCVARIGAIENYDKMYESCLAQNLQLINSPEEHLRASELPYWYPIIQDLTPESIYTDYFPPSSKVEDHFGWPVFIKGARQTSKHSLSLSIARNAQEYENISKNYQNDPILHWQKVVIRRFLPLEPLGCSLPGQVQASMEFRTFWWHQECIGVGPYWSQLSAYHAPDLNKGIELAAEAVQRLKIPFLVIDIAKTTFGEWIIIECNDAQESGYTGVSAYPMWQKFLSFLS